MGTSNFLSESPRYGRLVRPLPGEVRDYEHGATRITDVRGSGALEAARDAVRRKDQT